MITPAVRQDPRTVFEKQYLPEITARSFAHFSRLDPAARQEAIQDCVCQAWLNYRSATAHGKLTLADGAVPCRGRRTRGQVTPGTLALFANRNYNSGRRFSGSSNTDVMGEQTRLTGRVTVVSIDDAPPQADGVNDHTLREAMADRRAENAPAELAAQNIDWGNFYRSGLLDDRQRVVLDLLASGYRTSEIAQAISVSAPRAVQITDAIGEAAAQFFGDDIVPMGRRTGKPIKKRGRPSRKSIYIPLNARADTAVS